MRECVGCVSASGPPVLNPQKKEKKNKKGKKIQSATINSLDALLINSREKKFQFSSLPLFASPRFLYSLELGFCSMDTWKSTLQAETIAIARAHPEASHRGGNGLLGWAHGDYVCASGQASQRQAVMWSRSSVTMAPALPISSAGNLTLAPNELSIALQRNQCLDGSSSSTQRCNASIFSTKRKNYYSAEMLSKIALHEPKRARRYVFLTSYFYLLCCGRQYS